MAYKDKSKELATKSAWRNANRNKVRKYCRDWRERNINQQRERERLKAKTYRARNRVTLIEKCKEYRMKNSENIKLQRKLFKHSNPSLFRAWMSKAERNSRLRLKLKYIKILLRRSGKPITSHQIKLCRQRIQIRRSQKIFQLLAAASQLSSLSKT